MLIAVKSRDMKEVCDPKWGTKWGKKLTTSEKSNESDFLETLLSNFDRSRDSVEVWVREVWAQVSK